MFKREKYAKMKIYKLYLYAANEFLKEKKTLIKYRLI